MLSPRPSRAPSSITRSSIGTSMGADGQRSDNVYQTNHGHGTILAGAAVEPREIFTTDSHIAKPRSSDRPLSRELPDGTSSYSRHSEPLPHRGVPGSPIESNTNSSQIRPSDEAVDRASMPLTGDGRGRGSIGSGPMGGAIKDWWSNGGAREVGVLKSRGSVQLPRNLASADSTPPGRLRRPATSDFSTPSTAPPMTPPTSRFSFLTSPMSALSKLAQQSPTSSMRADDELLDLDVEKALFPGGKPSELDAFSPAAYKNLQANAVGLATRFQGAYRRRTDALRALESEGAAQKDELDEADTRAHLLRLQLEEMARRSEERELIIQQLLEELTAEKKARAEDQRRRALPSPLAPLGSKALSDDDGLTVSEDLGAEADQRLKKWRKSVETDTTDDNSVVEDASVFSRSRSPTIAPSVFDGGSVVGVDMPPPVPPKVVALGPPRPPPRLAMTVATAASNPQMSMFQKVIKGLAGEVARGEDDEVTGPGGRRGCGNCKGQDAGVAWNTVSLLRDENKGLKQRVAQLETSVESALDVVNGIGL